MSNRLTIQSLHDIIGITPNTPGYGKAFGPLSKTALFKRMSNKKAPALTANDLTVFASRMNVPVGHVRGVVKIEAPRGSYDDDGRPTNLYERHVADRNTVPAKRFRAAAPDLFGPPYGKGGYGAYSVQYDKLARACAYDPEAAMRACSWGMFQVLGENAVDIGYDSTWQMVASMVDDGEAAHLEAFRRFLDHNNLIGKLRACRPNDPDSCIPFVSAYNGAGFRQFSYHTKLAKAIAV